MMNIFVNPPYGSSQWKVKDARSWLMSVAPNATRTLLNAQQADNYWTVFCLQWPALLGAIVFGRE